ncbi:UDP-3-O-(3-hydroxymyristoyl)glucosamine N-acyltransferase [Insolitispirillum peregrinum]|uniref:UDP-3-O-(3-hydroxymyristoyl)glucosamine N-acyltransferase n=1 Tax=Insolitispirillum peregrinum TaxID=80876 RepID=UPI00361458BA
MADFRFFENKGPFSAASLAQAVGGELKADDPDALMQDVAPLSTAQAEHVSFLDNRQYIDQFTVSKAGLVIVRPEFVDRAPAGMALILTNDPYRAYAVIAALFHPRPAVVPGVSPLATIDPSARLGTGVEIAAGVVIGANVELGDHVKIAANVVIGDGVMIGAHSSVGPNATITHALIGTHVHIYPGCCIGQDGFGFAMGPKGHLKVPQLGRVIIGDDVEIGANTTIDRGAGPDTVIGPGCRIDNLVQIGHNVELGAGCVLVSQVGISGSTKLGRGVVVGGQAGLAGHLSIEDGVQIAGQSGVMRDIPKGTAVMGYPAKPIKEFWREVAALAAMVTRKKRTD